MVSKWSSGELTKNHYDYEKYICLWVPEFTWLFAPEKSKALTLQAKHYVLNVDYFPLEIMTGIVISRKSHYFIPLKTLFFLLLEEFLSIIYKF
jgi:hypothetical protein